MKRTIKTGPKRLRWRRRDWSGVGGYGQERRWGSTVGNFKAEREACRAGLTGKVTKHDPFQLNVIMYGEPVMGRSIGSGWMNTAVAVAESFRAPDSRTHRAPASGERARP